LNSQLPNQKSLPSSLCTGETGFLYALVIHPNGLANPLRLPDKQFVNGKSPKGLTKETAPFFI